MRKNYEDFRPDITHQCLLALLDSPLNKAGLLQVYIRTQKKALIEISPHIRIPRTFKRFSGLMAQLLTKLKVRAANSSAALMKTIKNPITDYLPMGIKIIGTSCKADVVPLRKYVKELGVDEKPICIVIGAVSTGNPGMENELAHENISISHYPLSAAAVCSKFTNAFEELWKVI